MTTPPNSETIEAIGGRRVAKTIRMLAALGTWVLLGTGSARPADAAPVLKLGGHVEEIDGSVRVRGIVKIADGYHINAHVPDEVFLIPTVLTLEADGVTFEEPTYPEPEAQTFAFSPDKPMLVYDGTIEMVALADVAPSGPVYAKLRYQACTDKRCLPPRTVEAVLSRNGAAPVGARAERVASASSGESWLFAWLQGASLPAALGMTLLLGLTLNLTPCVYPLISVTLGFFGSQPASGGKPWPLAVAYVTGITLSFATLGVTASLAGSLSELHFSIPPCSWVWPSSSRRWQCRASVSSRSARPRHSCSASAARRPELVAHS